MIGALVEISDKKIRNPALTLPSENGVAAYCRRRWPENTLGHIQAEWGLEVHEARAVLYGNASKRVLNKIDSHKNGGVMLALDLLCIRARINLEQLAAKLEERACDERDHQAADAERWGRTRRSLASRDGGSPKTLDSPEELKR